MFRRGKLALIGLFAALLFSLTSSPEALASPPITNGLVISLDASSGTTISGTTWSAQDGTTKNAIMQATGQYDSSFHYAKMTDVNLSPSYAYFDNTSAVSGDALNTAGDMTVETWAYFATAHTANWNIIITKWFGALNTNNGCVGTQDFHFGLLYGHPDIYVTGAGGQNISNTSYTVSNSSWHQIAFTIINPNTMSGSSANTSGTLVLYYDGVAINTVSGTNVYHTATPSCQMILGDSRVGTGGLGIDGGLEKVRIYNRALSAAEINTNYRADASTNGRSLTAGPFATVDPVISGPASYANTETGTSGTWVNGVTGYSYQWYRATSSGGSYSAISGASSQTYVTSSADVGNYLKLTVGATNASGTYYDTSTASPQISKTGITMGLSLATQIPIYRTTNNISASTGGQAGKVSFTLSGKAIPGCKSLPSNSGNSYTATCPWKPSQHSQVSVVATFTPTDTNYLSATKTLGPVQVIARSTNR